MSTVISIRILYGYGGRGSGPRRIENEIGTVDLKQISNNFWVYFLFYSLPERGVSVYQYKHDGIPFMPVAIVKRHPVVHKCTFFRLRHNFPISSSLVINCGGIKQKMVMFWKDAKVHQLRHKTSSFASFQNIILTRVLVPCTTSVQ